MLGLEDRTRCLAHGRYSVGDDLKLGLQVRVASEPAKAGSVYALSCWFAKSRFGPCVFGRRGLKAVADAVGGSSVAGKEEGGGRA